MKVALIQQIGWTVSLYGNGYVLQQAESAQFSTFTSFKKFEAFKGHGHKHDVLVESYRFTLFYAIIYDNSLKPLQNKKAQKNLGYP